MKTRFLVCALAIVALGFGGVAAAGMLTNIYDHFDNPATSVNTSLWTGDGVTDDTVASSVVTTAGVNWGALSSTTSFSIDLQQTYEFKYEGGAGAGIMGLSGVSHSAYIRYYGGWHLMVDGTADEGAVFTPVAGDILDLVRTATNWQVYQNGTLVSQSVGLGFGTGETARLFLASSPGVGPNSWDYVGIVKYVPKGTIFKIR